MELASASTVQQWVRLSIRANKKRPFRPPFSTTRSSPATHWTLCWSDTSGSIETAERLRTGSYTGDSCSVPAYSYSFKFSWTRRIQLYLYPIQSTLAFSMLVSFPASGKYTPEDGWLRLAEKHWGRNFQAKKTHQSMRLMYVLGACIVHCITDDESIASNWPFSGRKRRLTHAPLSISLHLSDTK